MSAFWRLTAEALLGVGFFVPFVAIPVAFFRVLGAALPGWQLGAISGLLVCGYWMTVCSIGLMQWSEVMSFFFIGNVAVAGIVAGLALRILFGDRAVPDWLYIALPYAMLFLCYTGMGALLGGVFGSWRRV
jgi:hypothetical protein